MKKKKHFVGGFKFVLVAVCAMSIVLLSACGSNPTGEANYTDSNEAGNAAASLSINVVSREDGSGTRSAFVELFDVQTENSDGKKVDATDTNAVITNSTSVMLTTVSSDPAAVGYISLGSLNDTVKALEIDGIEATTSNVKSGEYPIQRPFNIATKDTVSEAAQDFINFIMSSEGQKVIEANHYIAVNESALAYSSNNAEGKVVVAGSSSVSPVMEKLQEAYATANPKVSVEIQTSDSSTGMSSAIEGICDIGMASRELKDSELSKGIQSQVIALDGIAVIINTGNRAIGLTTEQVKDIYLGKITNWDEL